MSVILQTSVGDISIRLFSKEAPLASLNFLKLCKIKYYNGHVIHTVEHDVLFQTGDPTGTGKGGDSIFGILEGKERRFFRDEIVEGLKFCQPGLVAMANAGKDTNGSQFFVTLGIKDLSFLNGKYTIFGAVADACSLGTLERINQAILDDKNRPYRDILIEKTAVLADDFDDPPGLVVPPSSPPLSPTVLHSHRIDPGEAVPLTTLESERRKREAEARALTLEMIGDLPSADAKPLDTILFVCKLNPATTDEDLELIFSRFGPIERCEIIRDKKTGDSLQYAFIEFQQKEHCEEAYYKMENVLIDDRRIHVDFSQSVSKLYGSWRQRGASEKMPLKLADATMQLKPKHQSSSLDAKYRMVFDENQNRSTRHEQRAKNTREIQSHSRNQRRDDRHETERARRHLRSRSCSSSSVSPRPREKSRGSERERDRAYEYRARGKSSSSPRHGTQHSHRSRERRC